VKLRALHFLLSPALAGSLILASSVPAGAQTVSNPDLFEKSLEAAHEALAQFGEYSDPKELERIDRIGYRIVQAAGFDKFPVTFYLIDMPEPNAFALPGGQVFVTRGMLGQDLNDDEMAGLLGHEIAHVVLQHGVRMQRRATLLNVLSSAALIGVLIAAGNGNSRQYGVPVDPYGVGPSSGTNTSGDIVQGTLATSVVVSELLLRSYSREFEDEADAEGQRWAAAAGFSPNGTEELMATMRANLPQDKEYGYWQTHPFFDTRVTAAHARAQLLRVQPPHSADALRTRTQAVLLSYLKDHPDVGAPQHDKSEPPGREEPRRPPDAASIRQGPRSIGPAEMLRQAALHAWPKGPAADQIRLEDLHRSREAEERKPPLSRDLGSVLEAYGKTQKEVSTISPESPLLATLSSEEQDMRQELASIYPKALDVLQQGVYQTDFLATFLSNFPDAPQSARVALELGNAYARLGQQDDAVKMYLEALSKAPDDQPGTQARQGLKTLAPMLNQLSALQSLASDADDAQLRQLAADRLKEQASTFEALENGADYLQRYPNSGYATTVETRMNSLAEKLYNEIILYQTVGDHGKAIERIQQILSYAPLSPAAGKLRDRVQLEG